MPRFEPDPEHEAEQMRLRALPFRMPIEGIFTVKGHGTVVSGRVETGTLQRGDRIFIADQNKPIQGTIGLFMGFIRDPSTFIAESGDNIGFVLHGVEAEQLTVGMVIIKQDETDL